MIHLTVGLLLCHFGSSPKSGVRIGHSPGGALIGLTVWMSKMGKLVSAGVFAPILSGVWAHCEEK